jgi:hypothetical protein
MRAVTTGNTELTTLDTVVLSQSHGCRNHSDSLRRLHLLPPHALYQHVPMAETHWYLANSSTLVLHKSAHVDTMHSIPLYSPLDGFGYYNCYWNALTLPALASQLGVSDTRRSLLLQPQAFCALYGICQRCFGPHHLDHASLCCLGFAVARGSQARYHWHICLWDIVHTVLHVGDSHTDSSQDDCYWRSSYYRHHR